MANNNVNNNNSVPNPNNLPARSIDPRSITINNAYERRQEGRGPVVNQQQQLPQHQQQRVASRNGNTPNYTAANLTGDQQPHPVSLFNHNGINNNAAAAAAAPATIAPPGRTLTPTPSAAATANIRNWATTNGNMSFGEGEHTPVSRTVVVTPNSAVSSAPAIATPSYAMVMDDDQAAAAIMAGGGDDGKGIPLKVFST